MSSFKDSKKYLIVLSILFIFVVVDNQYYYFLGNIKIKDFKHYYFDDYKGELERVEKKYGINIMYDITSKPYLKLKRYEDPPCNVKFSRISDFELCRYAYLLSSALDLYPESAISKNLNGIVLLGTLNFSNVKYGGTCIDGILYLTSNGRNEGFSDDYLTLLFHHEMSSVFFSKFEFDFKKWMALNPKKFSYMKTEEDVLASIRKGGNYNYNDPNLLKHGFLYSYAKTNFENDFNLYAEALLSKNGKKN